MNAQTPEDIRQLHDALEAAERDAEALVDGLTESQGTAQLSPASWSVARCLDHLATGNRVYLDAMVKPIEQARAQGKLRRRPATPGVGGGFFVYTLEPPPKWWTKLKAPGKIQPQPSPPLAESFSDFMTSHAEARTFLRENADLDLATIRFPNPFIPGLRFSLATGLHVLSAHARRHLWQAWGVRRAIEDANRPS